MKSANPALNEKAFGRYRSTAQGDVMTVQGATNKTLVLLFLTMISAGWAWNLFSVGKFQAVAPWMWGGLIVGLLAFVVIMFKPDASPFAAPVYALGEGLFLGGISSYVESIYPGIVMQAVGLTFGTLFMILALYKLKIVQATENFKMGVIAATGAIFLVYLVTIILGFFNIRIPFIHGSGWIGIGFSLFVVVIAALNLVLDFDFIEHGEEVGAPKFMEWYAAFGLMVTLLWLYIEILHLLMKLNSRD